MDVREIESAVASVPSLKGDCRHMTHVDNFSGLGRGHAVMAVEPPLQPSVSALRLVDDGDTGSNHRTYDYSGWMLKSPPRPADADKGLTWGRRLRMAVSGAPRGV
jgi:hypothetical protein